MERSLDGELYYDTYPVFEEIDKSLDIMYEPDEFWNTVEGSPSLHGCSDFRVDTVDDNSYLDDVSVACPAEPEYLDGYFTLDNPKLWILSQGV